MNDILTREIRQLSNTFSITRNRTRHDATRHVMLEADVAIGRTAGFCSGHLNVAAIGRWLCLCLLLLALPACQSQSTASSSSPDTAIVTINGETFVCNLATDPESRERGMSGRTEFDKDGMLFVFPQPAMQSFWMYECRIDIDLIFLDALGYVTATHEMTTEPPRGKNESEAAYRNRLNHYTSGYPAQFAIELPAGSIDRLDVHVEDRVKLDRTRLKALAE